MKWSHIIPAPAAAVQSMAQTHGPAARDSDDQVLESGGKHDFRRRPSMTYEWTICNALLDQDWRSGWRIRIKHNGENPFEKGKDYLQRSAGSFLCCCLRVIIIINRIFNEYYSSLRYHVDIHPFNIKWILWRYLSHLLYVDIGYLSLIIIMWIFVITRLTYKFLETSVPPL